MAGVAGVAGGAGGGVAWGVYFRHRAFDGDGGSIEAIDACRRGLRRASRRPDAGLRLRSALAQAPFMAGEVDQAGSVALELIGLLQSGPRERPLRAVRALGLSGRGMPLRAQSETAAGVAAEVLREASEALLDAARIFDESDLRTSMGTTGRLPEFREIGWQPLALSAVRRTDPMRERRGPCGPCPAPCALRCSRRRARPHSHRLSRARGGVSGASWRGGRLR